MIERKQTVRATYHRNLYLAAGESRWPVFEIDLGGPPTVIDAMEEREEEAVFPLWVNWERRVISFSSDEGFEELQFKTYDDKFRFAIEKGNEGFGIQ